MPFHDEKAFLVYIVFRLIVFAGKIRHFSRKKCGLFYFFNRRTRFLTILYTSNYHLIVAFTG